MKIGKRIGFEGEGPDDTSLLNLAHSILGRLYGFQKL